VKLSTQLPSSVEGKNAWIYNSTPHSVNKLRTRGLLAASQNSPVKCRASEFLVLGNSITQIVRRLKAVIVIYISTVTKSSVIIDTYGLLAAGIPTVIFFLSRI
jgi:hypothetical protein